MSVDLTIYTTRKEPLAPDEIAERLERYGLSCTITPESTALTTRWFVAEEDEDADTTAIDSTLIIFDVNAEPSLVRLSAIPIIASYPEDDPALSPEARGCLRNAQQSLFGSTSMRSGNNYRMLLLVAVACVDLGKGVVEDPALGGFYTRDTVPDLIARDLPADVERVRAVLSGAS